MCTYTYRPNSVFIGWDQKSSHQRHQRNSIHKHQKHPKKYERGVDSLGVGRSRLLIGKVKLIFYLPELSDSVGAIVPTWPNPHYFFLHMWLLSCTFQGPAVARHILRNLGRQQEPQNPAQSSRRPEARGRPLLIWEPLVRGHIMA